MIQINETVGLDTYEDDLEEQKPRGRLQITDVSGVSSYDDAAQAAKDEVEVFTSAEGGGAASAAPLALINGFLSYSQIDLFTQCPSAYYKRYFEKKRPKKHPAARLGTTVHKVLEKIYRWALKEGYRGKFPIERSIDILREVWRDPEDGLAGEPHEWWADAIFMIRNYAQAVPAIDASEVLGVELGEEDGEDPTVEDDGKGFNSDDAPPGAKPLPPGTIMLGGFPFIAKIDRVERLDAESILITDYKSDRQIRWREEVDRDLQLTIYEIAVRRRFPWAKRVVLELFMLRHGMAQRAKERTPEDLHDAEMFVAETGHAILHEKEWAPKLNRWCHTCGYKMECPKYKAALDGTDGSEEAALIRDLVQIGDKHVTELAEGRDQFDHREKILKKRKDEIDKALKATLELTPGNTLITDSREYYLGLTTRKEFPRADTANLLSRYLKVPSTVIDSKIASVEKALLDGVLEKVRDGKKPLGKIFGYEGPGADRIVSSAEYKMLALELENIAILTPSTRIMSRNRKSSDARRTGASRKEEQAKQATLPAKLVDQAAVASKTVMTLKGQGRTDDIATDLARSVELLRAAEIPPVKTDDIETPADVLRAWTASKWAELEAVGEVVERKEPHFKGVEEDWLEPSTVVTLWRAAGERIGPAAYAQPGVIKSLRSKPVAAGEPATKVAETATSVAPAAEPAKRKRKPMTEETRAKLSAKAAERWARERAAKKEGES